MSAQDHQVRVEWPYIHTRRLTLRPWSHSDAPAALTVYGDIDVAKWLAPAMARTCDLAEMEQRLTRWSAESAETERPNGRWAITSRETGEVFGGVALLPLPPDNVDCEIAWQLAAPARGRGLASEAGHAVAHQAFESGVDELFAVVRPHNTRAAATARRVGMEWVGETDKYYQLTLDVYRLRKGDLDIPIHPGAPRT